MAELEEIIDRYCTGLAARPFPLHRHLGAPARQSSLTD
jgi:hypothetical protein